MKNTSPKKLKPIATVVGASTGGLLGAFIDKKAEDKNMSNKVAKAMEKLAFGGALKLLGAISRRVPAIARASSRYGDEIGRAIANRTSTQLDNIMDIHKVRAAKALDNISMGRGPTNALIDDANRLSTSRIAGESAQEAKSILSKLRTGQYRERHAAEKLKELIDKTNKATQEGLVGNIRANTSQNLVEPAGDILENMKAIGGATITKAGAFTNEIKNVASGLEKKAFIGPALRLGIRGASKLLGYTDEMADVAKAFSKNSKKLNQKAKYKDLIDPQAAAIDDILHGTKISPEAIARHNARVAASGKFPNLNIKGSGVKPSAKPSKVPDYDGGHTWYDEARDWGDIQSLPKGYLPGQDMGSILRNLIKGSK